MKSPLQQIDEAFAQLEATGYAPDAILVPLDKVPGLVAFLGELDGGIGVETGPYDDLSIAKELLTKQCP